jgi:hypothetical protein
VTGDDPKNPEADTADIDGGWGEAEPEPAPKAKPSPKPLPPLPVPSTLVGVSKLSDLDDDQIEFEDGSVEQDSLPTVQHPNPLMFDRAPESGKPGLPPSTKKLKR